MIPSGQRRERITIQPYTGTVDKGVVRKSWGAGLLRWARVRMMAGSELQLGNRVVADASHEFMVARPTTIDIDDRITWNGRVFDIASIDDTNPGELKILAKAGPAQGA